MAYSRGLKSDRVLYIYDKLVSGEILKKAALSEHFEVSEKSIQRDIDALRCFLSDRRFYEFELHNLRQKRRNAFCRKKLIPF